MPRLRKPALSDEVIDASKPSGNGDLVPRNGKGQFVEGAIGNPLGRNAESKNAISHAFLTDLQALWEDQGPAILKRVAKKNPQAIVAAMAALVPKGQVANDTQRIYVIQDRPLTADEWAAKHCGNVPIPEPDGTPH